MYYTDYPIFELGDEPNKEAPIRTVMVLSYDGDKYCDIIVGGVVSTIKAGYIYKERGRCGEVEKFNPNYYPKRSVSWQR